MCKENQLNLSNKNILQTGLNKIGSLSIFVLILIVSLSIIVTFVFYDIQKYTKPSQYIKSKPGSGLATQTPLSTTATQLQIFPVKVSSDDNDVDAGRPAPCQPEFFDPKISKFIKHKQEGTRSEFYEIQGFEGGNMMIDGWIKEGEYKVVLPAPFDVTIYHFGCASNFSSVIDLTKNGNRQDLYTHVLNYSFSKDGKNLYLINNVNNQGSWTLHKRIINIETKETSEVPNIKCVSNWEGFWQGDRLLTYTEDEDVGESDYRTDICVWNKSAKLISRIGATTAWGAASGSFLAEKIGLLPLDLDIFYTFTSKDENTCSLYLANIINGATKSIDIFDKRNYSDNYYCASPSVEFDFSELHFNNGILKYRIEKDPTIWEDWQTISVK